MDEPRQPTLLDRAGNRPWWADPTLHPSRVAAWTLVVASVVGVAIAGHVATQRSDFRVTRLEFSSTQVQRGGRLAISEVTRNAGPVSAVVATRTSFYLSTVARVDRSMVPVGSVAVPPLDAGTEAVSSGEVRIPNDLTPGHYVVVACADADYAVPERNERNNCRVSPIGIVVEP